MNKTNSRHHTRQTQKFNLRGPNARPVICILIAAIIALLFSPPPAACDTTASVQGTTLNVFLGSSNDTATIVGVALNSVTVYGTGLPPTPISGFQGINVQDTGVNTGQSINFTGAGGVNIFPSAAVNISGIETISIKSLSAGSFVESGATGGVNIGGLNTTGSQTFNDSVTLTGYDITGNYSQSGTSVYNVLVDQVGTSFILPSFIDVTGSATLGAGALLNVSLTGANPPNGTSFDILDYGSLSGTYTISDPLFNNGTQQWVISSYTGGDGDDIVLTAESAVAQTPEPSSLLLLGTGLLGLMGMGLYKKRLA